MRRPQMALAMCVLGTGWMTTGADAEEGASAASRPAVTATRPAEPSAEVVRILDRLEKKDVRDIEADLVFVKYDPVVDFRQKFSGTLRFKQAEPNPRFWIHFDRVINDGILEKDPDEWHVFDGRWYKEARLKTRQIIEREVVREGEELDVFRVGKGPFPLPFGQKKGDILEHFSIELVGPVKGDPEDADHLACTPLPGSELDERYGKVHFWVDRKMDVPVRVQTVEKSEGKEITATFSKVKLNKGLRDRDLELPTLKDYSVRTEPLPDRASTQESGG